jgi:predicted TIM-barrel fold metal-dependent hydrolase
MHHGIIDVHTHIIPECYRAALTDAGRIMEDGFPCPPWSVQQHIAFMDKVGIDVSVLSISSPHHMQALTAKEVALTRQINNEMAALTRKNARFRFAACLPLPMVEESVAEACRALDELGAVAVKFPTNACGIYPADARFAPLMDELNRRNAVIMFHPCKPAAVPEGCFTAGPLPLFEFLGDTTRAVIDLIANNVPARWPNIRFVVPHMGSFLPPLMNRLAGLSKIPSQQKMVDPIDLPKALQSFYFDLTGNALDAAIAGLLTMTTPDRLLFGSDFPFTPVPMAKENLRILQNHPLTAPHLEEICVKNANKLLHL